MGFFTVRGINKRIIEVNMPDNDVFDKAVFFVKASHLNEDESTLRKNAADYLYNICKLRRNPLIRLSTLPYFLKLLSAAAIGAAIALLIIKI